MDITKIKSAIENAKAEIKKTTDAEIAARSFGALKALSNVDASLDKSLERLATAEKRGQPRVKKSKKAKGAVPATAAKK